MILPLIGTISLKCLIPALAAPTSRARRGGAATPPKVSQHFGAFVFSANDFQYVGTPTGFKFILGGNANLAGAGRTIEARKISIDVQKKASDIHGAEATGDVRMAIVQAGRKTTAQSQTLVYNRAMDHMDVGGGVKIHSDLENQEGTVDATGERATIDNVSKQGVATISGGVDLVLVKPDTLQGPAHFTGSSMTIDLRTGDYKLSGEAKGNFTLPPPKPSGKQ